jgi:hypothetical protein
VRGQFHHQPIGQRPDGVVVILLRLVRLAADGDDGSLYGGCGGLDAVLAGGPGLATGRLAVIDGRRFVLGPNVAAIP